METESDQVFTDFTPDLIKVVNLAYGTGLASVVRKEIGAGPLNIVVDNLGLAQIDRIKIASQSIVLGQQRFGFKDEHLYNSTIELEELNWGDFEKT